MIFNIVKVSNGSIFDHIIHVPYKTLRKVKIVKAPQFVKAPLIVGFKQTICRSVT